MATVEERLQVLEEGQNRLEKQVNALFERAIERGSLDPNVFYEVLEEIKSVRPSKAELQRMGVQPAKELVKSGSIKPE